MLIIAIKIHCTWHDDVREANLACDDFGSERACGIMFAELCDVIVEHAQTDDDAGLEAG